MNRYQHNKPQIVQPKKKIELNDSQRLKRLIITILLIIIGMVFIGIGMKGCLAKNTGWQEISYNGGYTTDFTFYYYLGSSDTNPTTENKKLTVLYSNYLKQAFGKYSAWMKIDNASSSGMYDINDHINDVTTIDKSLYESIQKVLESDNSRVLYLAPINALYEGVLTASSNIQSEELDPFLNNEQKAVYDEFMTYISDNNAIRLELLDNYQVKLIVSDAYYNLCSSYFERPVFVDFCYLMNAFIIDEVTDKLINDGYNNGVIYTNDGYKRVFTNNFNVNNPIYDYVDNEKAYITSLVQNGNISEVTFKNYPTSDDEVRYSCIYDNGTRRSMYLKDTDYSNTSCVDYLQGISETEKCSTIALKMINIYLNDSLDTNKLKDLSNNNIYYIYINNKQIHYNQEGFNFDSSQTNEKYIYEMVLE